MAPVLATMDRSVAIAQHVKAKAEADVPLTLPSLCSLGEIAHDTVSRRDSDIRRQGRTFPARHKRCPLPA